MIQFNFDGSKFTSDMKVLATAKAAIMPKVFRTFHDFTPVRSGNAKSHTFLDNNNDIQANYAYAKRLDNGWSKQHGGVGMTNPATKTMNTEISKFISKNTTGA